MKVTIIKTITTLILTAILAACGDATTVGDPSEPTVGEAVIAVSTAGFASGSAGTGGVSFSSLTTSLPGLVEINDQLLAATETRDLTDSGTCASGGTYSVSGSVDVTTNSGSSSTDATYSITYDDCRSTVMQAALDGLCTFTLTVDGTIEIDGEGSQTGGSSTATATNQITTSAPLTITYESTGNTSTVDLAITQTVSVAGITNTGLVTIDGNTVDIDTAATIFEQTSTNSACP